MVNDMIYKLYDLYSKNNPDSIAFKTYETDVTYGELISKIDIFTKKYKNLFYDKKIRILFLEHPSIDLSIAYLSLVNVGAVCFFLHPNIEEVDKYVEKYEIDIVISEKPTKTSITLNELLNSSFKFSIKTKRIEVYDACTAFFTSGTSGEPKCVLLSEKNFCTNVISGYKKIEYLQNDIHLCLLPFYHAYGITCSLLGPLYSGGLICFGKSIGTILSDINIFKPTFIQTVPMILRSLLAYQSSNPISIKKILSGGAYTPVELIDEFRKRGIAVYSCYGMTECSPCISCNDNKKDKDASVGKLLNCNDIMFVDDEIFLKGTNVMIGYFGEEKIKDWFPTGDCGYIDNDGYLYLTGRKNGCIKLANGEKIYPEEIEKIANKYPNVVESRLRYINQNILLEVFALEKLQVDDIKLFVETELNHSIVIEKVIQVVNELPKTTTMKIRR